MEKPSLFIVATIVHVRTYENLANRIKVMC